MPETQRSQRITRVAFKDIEAHKLHWRHKVAHGDTEAYRSTLEAKNSSWRQKQIGHAVGIRVDLETRRHRDTLKDRGMLESQECTWRHWVHKETLRCSEACWQHRVALGDYEEHRGVLVAQG